MKSVDLLVLCVIVGVVAFPLIKGAATKLLAKAKPLASAESKPAWQQRWTNTLIELLADLDGDGNKAAASLCRELMWEIIGGDQGTAKK